MGINADLNLHIFRSSKFRSVVDDAIRFFSETPAHRLPPPDRFIGGGVYALYYIGGFELYRPIAFLNSRALMQPIYVGKAVPAGWRTARTQISESANLFGRLVEHARSIAQATNLDIDELQCRFMILQNIESDLVVPVEAELIGRFMPLWNSVVDGFGNHDPGSGRYNQAKSEWDILHSGRPWAERLTGASPRLEDTVEKVQRALRKLPLP